MCGIHFTARISLSKLAAMTGGLALEFNGTARPSASSSLPLGSDPGEENLKRGTAGSLCFPSGTLLQEEQVAMLSARLLFLIRWRNDEELSLSGLWVCRIVCHPLVSSRERACSSLGLSGP